MGPHTPISKPHRSYSETGSSRNDWAPKKGQRGRPPPRAASTAAALLVLLPTRGLDGSSLRWRRRSRRTVGGSNSRSAGVVGFGRRSTGGGPRLLLFRVNCCTSEETDRQTERERQRQRQRQRERESWILDVVRELRGWGRCCVLDRLRKV